jgi:hypothetical protein
LTVTSPVFWATVTGNAPDAALLPLDAAPSSSPQADEHGNGGEEHEQEAVNGHIRAP